MTSLLILGAGGHGKVVADIAQTTGKWAKIAFLDDRHPDLRSILHWPVIGYLEQASDFLPDFSDFNVAIGNNKLRVELLHRFLGVGYSAPPLIHPQAYVSPFASLGSGSVISAQSVVNVSSKIGLGCIVNTGASVGHDVILGDGVQLAPGVLLAGGASIGDMSMLGMGTSVIQQVKIGENVIVGAGAVVLSNVEDYVTVVGTPAKIIKNHDS